MRRCVDAWAPSRAPAALRYGAFRSLPCDADSAASSSFRTRSVNWCLELFFGKYSGDWDVIYQRWSTQLGEPSMDAIRVLLVRKAANDAVAWGR